MNCPNCHKEIPADSKFCTYCGFQIPQVQPEPSAAVNMGPQPNQFQEPQFQQTAYQNTGAPNNFAQSAQLDQSIGYAKNYWSYLIHGVRRPSDIDEPFNKFFGLISMMVNNFLLALIITLLGVHSVFSLTSSYGTISGPVTIMVFLVTFIFGTIGSFFTYSMTHLVTRGFLGDKTADYMTDMTRYYHISSLGIFALAVGFVFSLLGTFAIPLVIICLFINSVMLTTAFAALIFKAHATTHFDVVYAYLTGIVVMTIVGFIALSLMAGMISFSFLSHMSEPFSYYMR